MREPSHALASTAQRRKEKGVVVVEGASSLSTLIRALTAWSRVMKERER